MLACLRPEQFLLYCSFCSRMALVIVICCIILDRYYYLCCFWCRWSCFSLTTLSWLPICLQQITVVMSTEQGRLRVTSDEWGLYVPSKSSYFTQKSLRGSVHLNHKLTTESILTSRDFRFHVWASKSHPSQISLPQDLLHNLLFVLYKVKKDLTSWWKPTLDFF